MKKLIFNKLYIDTASFFLTSLLIMSLIVWTLQAVNYFDFVTEDGHGLRVYFSYTLLNFPKIINYVRENNSVDFRNRLSESLNVAISVEELTMQAYNTCGKDKGDIAQNYFETTMMPKYEEIIEKSISAGTVLGFALKSRDVISGKTKEDRKKKIKQRTEMLGNIYSVGKKFIEKSASDEQGYEVLKEKLRYISR